MENESTLKAIEAIERVEWSNQPVLTTARLAEFYETTVIRIQQNYNNNEDRFLIGKHFFKLEGDALVEFKNYFVKNEVVPKHAPHLYLWTERGAARHAKMLNTDKAWDVFEALEDNYFNRPAVTDTKLAILDGEWLAYERNRLALNRARLRLDSDRFNLDSDRLGLDRDRIELDRSRFGFERERFMLERRRMTLDSERLDVERKRLALEFEQVEMERRRMARERDNFAKAQLLQELAAASGDNQTLRNSFLREAAKLVTGKELSQEIHCIREV